MKQNVGKDFFISYTSADLSWAEWIAWQLEDAGYSVVLQAWDFRPGSDFIMEMDRASQEARRTIAVLSPDYLTARYTRPEWRVAYQREINGEHGSLLPVIIRRCGDQLAGMLALISYIDLVGLNEQEAREELLAGINRGRVKPTTPPGYPPEPHHSRAKRPRFPGAFPQYWHVPYQRNEFFTDYKDILKWLYETLRIDKTVELVQPLALIGLGGIGKTQMAIEYAYRHRDHYQFILWIQADTRQALISDFVDIARLLDLPQKDDQNQTVIVNAVKHWLESNTGWLLIFDNVDDLVMVREFFPAKNQGHILLTTRLQVTEPIARAIEIEKMEPEEGASFLLRRAGFIARDAGLEVVSDADFATAQDIVEALDGLPLALDQAGAYICETRCGLVSYLSVYRKQRTELLKRRGNINSRLDHPFPVASTWAISFKKVEQANSTAANLLRLCAFVAPDAIPEEIFTEGSAELGRAFRPLADNEHKLNITIEELLKYSLVKRNPDTKTLTIHRLVQAVLKDQMSDRTQRQWSKRIIRALDHLFPREAKYEHWSRCQRLLPHVQVCADLITHWNLVFTQAARLLNGAGLYLTFRAQYAEGERFIQQAITIVERTWVPRKLDLAACLNNLALVYHHQHKYEQAASSYQRSLEIVERVYGLKHPARVYCLNNLADIYRVQRKYEQAIPLFQKAIAIGEEILGPEHHLVTVAYNNLGLVYRDQGKYEQAKPLLQRALEIKRRTLQFKDPSIANSLHNLALLYHDQHKYEQAKPLYEEALEINESVLGEEHPDTIVIRENYNRLLHDMQHP